MSRCILFLQGPSELLNPTLDKGVIEAAFDDDPESARAEWGGLFRQDVSAYLDDDAIDQALAPGEKSRSRMLDVAYVGFVDPAGGVAGGDAMTCAVGHQGERGRCYIDQLLAIDPPFDTEAAVERCAMVLKSFGITHATADRYAGLWPAQSFQRHGIILLGSELDKSAIYREVAPLFVSRMVSLVDDARLEVELRGLERTPRSGGRGDAVDHAPRAHDDRINACAGALWLASKQNVSTVAASLTSVSSTRSDYDPLIRDEERSRPQQAFDPRAEARRSTVGPGVGFVRRDFYE